MKIYKSLALLFASLLLFPTGGKGMDESTAFSDAQRNLATPKSRLVGHWADVDGNQIYFGPIDSSTNEGTQIQVYPDKDKYLEVLKQRYHMMGMKFNIDKETIDMVNKLGGNALPARYRIRSYEPAGTKITIENYFPTVFKELAAGINELDGMPLSFIIEKDGETLKTDPLADMEYLNKKFGVHLDEQTYLKTATTFRYIDAKTSPEGD